MSKNKYLTEEQQMKLVGIKAYRALPEERQRYYAVIRDYVSADWDYVHSDQMNTYNYWDTRIPEIIAELEHFNEPDLLEYLKTMNSEHRLSEVKKDYPMIEFVGYRDPETTPCDIIGAVMVLDEHSLDKIIDYSNRLLDVIDALNFDPQGRFLWTPSAPLQEELREYAEQTKNKRYYGVSSSKRTYDALQRLYEININKIDLERIDRFYIMEYVSKGTVRHIYSDIVFDPNLDRTYASIEASGKHFSYFLDR